jgi:hypothetical protein
MNLRLFSAALLVSALPIFAWAESHGVRLNASDFISAEKISPSGETEIRVKLSKSGRSKLKKLGAAASLATGTISASGAVVKFES